MARTSTRESVYPTGAGGTTSFDFLNHLEDCVTATEECTATLQAGLDRLEPGIRDLPRLTKVLGNRHHYLVLPQPTIQSHHAALSASLAPQIDGLISKAESLLDAEKGRLSRLEERLSILRSAQVPAPQAAPRYPTTFAESKDSPLGELDMRELSVAQRRKVMVLRSKREKLEKERVKLGVS